MKKIICIGMMLIMCLGIFCACVDYGYEFHFSVVGGNGSISATSDSLILESDLCAEVPWCELPCSDTSRIVSLLGGKEGSHELTFIAYPDDGYQVKEWIFNDKTVEGNKSNSFTAKVSDKENYCGVIAVEFEPIS